MVLGAGRLGSFQGREGRVSRVHDDLAPEAFRPAGRHVAFGAFGGWLLSPELIKRTNSTIAWLTVSFCRGARAVEVVVLF